MITVSQVLSKTEAKIQYHLSEKGRDVNMKTLHFTEKKIRYLYLFNIYLLF